MEFEAVKDETSFEEIQDAKDIKRLIISGVVAEQLGSLDVIACEEVRKTVPPTTVAATTGNIIHLIP